jgi:hypothetical protein
VAEEEAVPQERCSSRVVSNVPSALCTVFSVTVMLFPFTILVHVLVEVPVIFPPPLIFTFEEHVADDELPVDDP